MFILDAPAYKAYRRLDGSYPRRPFWQSLAGCRTRGVRRTQGLRRLPVGRINIYLVYRHHSRVAGKHPSSSSANVIQRSARSSSVSCNSLLSSSCLRSKVKNSANKQEQRVDQTNRKIARSHSVPVGLVCNSRHDSKSSADKRATRRNSRLGAEANA